MDSDESNESEMPWQETRRGYRVGKDKHGSLGIYEVTYDGNQKPCAISEVPAAITGSNMSDLTSAYGSMHDAFNRPVLSIEKIRNQNRKGLT